MSRVVAPLIFRQFGPKMTGEFNQIQHLRNSNWAISKSIFTKTHNFLESLIRGVSNPALYSVRKIGLFYLFSGGSSKLLADRFNHSNPFLVIPT